MICQRCKKNQATIFYEESINGKSRSYSLCPDCASELEKSGELSINNGFYNMGSGLFSFPTHHLHDDLLGGLFGIPEKAETRGKTCPTCHSTFNELVQTGRVGCTECYKVFSNELSSTIRSLHGNVRHVGRSPLGSKKKNEKADHLAELRDQLKSAISSEDFELAAKLRDEIRGLEGAQ